MGGDGNRSLIFRVGVTALFLLYVAAAGTFAYGGRINQDEGWYLYAAGLVYDGWLPYRDFAFFQAPLLPFVYGLPQKLLGAGLPLGRITSLLFGAAAIALGARLSFVRGGRFGALVFLALAPLTPLLLWTYTTTRTEPLSAFLLTLSALLLFRRDAGPASASAAALAAMLAAATRISSLPLAGLVVAWVAHRHRRSPRALGLAVGPALLVAGLLAALVAAAGAESTWFHLVTSQTERHVQLQDLEPWTLWRQLSQRAIDVAALRSFFGGVPLVSFACAAGALAAWVARRDRNSVAARASALALFAFVAYLPNLAPRVVYPVYFAAVLPLFLALASWCIGHVHARASREGRRAIAAGVGVVLAFQLGTLLSQSRNHLPAGTPDLAALRQGAEHLSEVVPPGALLGTLDTYLAVASERRVPRSWEMGLFSYFPKRSPEDGERLHLLTRERLAASLADPLLGAVVLSDRSLGLLSEHGVFGYRPMERLTEEQIHEAVPGLTRFRLDHVFEDFGQFHDRVYVLLPRVE
ncbi:MAG: hypothetical protein ABFS41_01980 [Myxococcota bacterium]